MISTKVLVGTILATTFMVSAEASAQAAQDTEAGAEITNTEENGDIIVTARRKEEKLFDIPVAVTVLSADQLHSRGLNDVESLRFAAPALQVSPTPFGKSVPGYTIRSQRSLESIITQDPAVGIYFAEVVQQRPHGTNASLFDLGSVEVLKGPQGTLFGRNTTGGAVLINPARPVFETGGSFELEGGNYGLVRGTAALNLPLNDAVALRVAGRVTRRDGYVKNLINGSQTDDERTESVRGSLLIKPNSDFSSIFVINYFHENDAGSGFVTAGLRPGSSFAANANFAASFARQQSRSDFWSVENSAIPYAKVNALSVSNTTTLNLGNATLKNIAGYRKVKTDAAFDYDGSSATVFESRNLLDAKQWTEELQISGNASDKLSYIGGVYYFYESGRDTQNSILFGTRANDGQATNKSKSIFAQIGYKIAENLNLTAGGRYTWDDRNLVAFNKLNGVCRLTDATGAPLSPCAKEFDTSFKSPSWLVSLDYKPSEDLMVYLSHRRGYRSGGWNLRANRPSEQVPFRPEFVNDIELGLKGKAIDGRLTFAAAGYYQWYKDIQRTLSFIPAPGQPLATVILNAADATIKGGEVEVTAKPWQFLELGGSIAYSDASYSDFVSPSGVNLSDNEFAMAPKWTYSLRARVFAPIDPAQGDLSASLSWYHQTRMFASDLNVGVNADVPIPSYGVLDASVEWQRVGGSNFDIRLLMKNVSNRKYFTGGSATYASLGSTGFIMGAPRTFSLSVTYKFGEMAK